MSKKIATICAKWDCVCPNYSNFQGELSPDSNLKSFGSIDNDQDIETVSTNGFLNGETRGREIDVKLTKR